MPCSNCGRPPGRAERHCISCGTDVGFPNVRIADSAEEKRALRTRKKHAQSHATTKFASSQLQEFQKQMQLSQVVVVRSLGDLHDFVKSDNKLYITFHKQIAAGYRLPEDNRWDTQRASVESAIHPHYHHEISYAALSLSGLGLSAYGGYHITLKDLMVARRTSFFEENPFHFFEEQQIIVGNAVPPGFRATRQNRGDLAIAKLYKDIISSRDAMAFSGLLCQDGATTDAGRYVEAHIYGPIHRSSISRVIGKRPRNDADRMLWKSVKRELRLLGATVKELA